MDNLLIGIKKHLNKIAVLLIVVAIIIVVFESKKDFKIAQQYANEYQSRQIRDVVDSIEKTHQNKITIYLASDSEIALGKYNGLFKLLRETNLNLNEIVKKGDSIIKLTGEFDIVVKPKNGKEFSISYDSQ